MGIYLHNMEMPKDNTVLLRIYPENDGVFYVEQLDIDDDILEKYWAVPVQPHGRLIDADAVSLEGGPYEYDEWCKWALDQYQNAPTVIEAEEGE